MITKAQRKRLSDIVFMVADLIHVERFNELDAIYADIDYENVTVVELISYIRTAYRCRNHLQQWYQLVDYSYNKAVIEHGEKQADHIFRGLR